MLFSLPLSIRLSSRPDPVPIPINRDGIGTGIGRQGSPLRCDFHPRCIRLRLTAGSSLRSDFLFSLFSLITKVLSSLLLVDKLPHYVLHAIGIRSLRLEYQVVAYSPKKNDCPLADHAEKVQLFSVP